MCSSRPPANVKRQVAQRQVFFGTFFIKSAERKNSAHYWASCRACCDAGTKDSMKHHIKNCTNLTEEQKRTAIGEGCAVSGSCSSVTNSTQAKLNKFVAVKDVPHCDTEPAKLERLALCATLSADLP
ncbi:TPA: hypothetical protein ACH3X1_005333 [Trebouxia sp. C0004]